MRRTILLLAAVALAGSAAACGGDDEDPPIEIAGVEHIRIPPYEHTREDVEYDRSPPAGGPHGPEAAPCRFFDQAIRDEPAVHSLEHGAVWLAYSPSLPAEDLAVLRALTEDHDDVLASPYAGLRDGEAVVATAWGEQLRLTSVGDPRLVAFVEGLRNRDAAPEASVGCPRE